MFKDIGLYNVSAKLEDTSNDGQTCIEYFTINITDSIVSPMPK